MLCNQVVVGLLPEQRPRTDQLGENVCQPELASLAVHNSDSIRFPLHQRTVSSQGPLRSTEVRWRGALLGGLYFGYWGSRELLWRLEAKGRILRFVQLAFLVTPIHDWQAKPRTIVLTSAGGLFPHRLCQLYRVDLGGETEHLKHPNPVPVDINFVPLQAVTRRRWVGMMVVVPPFAECQ